MIFNSSLFWYKLVFMGELLIAEGLCTYTLKKRSNFGLRVILSFFACIVIAFLFPLFENSFNAVYISVMFFALFAVSLTALKFCFDEPWINIIFCGIIAYTFQHMAYETYNVIVSFSGLQSFGNTYEITGGGENSYNGFTFLCWFGCYALLYWVMWAFVAYRIRQEEDLKISNLSLLFFSIIVVLINIVLNAVVTYAQAGVTTVIYAVLYTYNLVSSTLAIGMLFSLLGKQITEKELEIVRNLWERDKKVFEISKANIEIINVKCHDLKKQVRALREMGDYDEESLKEIEHAINIYDSSINTGCNVLDVILAEKSLICEVNGIDLTAIADGEKLGFMSNLDTYSLLENAISNAIEAVIKVEDKSKRFVRLRINQVGNFVSIHVENYCKAMPTLVNGLPKTTKGNSNEHGYGIRSMQLIAEKYGGELSIGVIDETFNLDIILPLEHE